MSTLLAHLAHKFTDQNELVVTDALSFVLSTSPPACNAFEVLLGAANDAVVVARVVPEFVAGSESRPDLATFDRDGTLTALIEGKLWAGLTPAQPVDYLRRLFERHGKALMFIVPAARVAPVMGAVTERARAAGITLIQLGVRGDLHACATTTGIRLVFVSWRTVLTALTAACERADDGRGTANLNQLSGLVELYESEGFAPMGASELSDLTVPRTVAAMYSLMQKLLAKATADKVVTLGGTALGTVGSGRYVSLRHHASALICYDPQAWLRFQAGPLWICFFNNENGRAQEVRHALRRLEAEMPRRLHVAETGHVWVPLLIRPDKDENEVLVDLVQQVGALDTELAHAGFVQTVGAQPIA